MPPIGAGKLFHHPAGFVDLRGWDEFFRARRAAENRRAGPLESWTVDDPILPDPYPNSIFNHDRKPANKFFLEWGRVLNENEEKMADTIRTEWACDLMRQKHDKPVFVAVGLYTPHFPNYAPEKYFDLYDREQIELPPYKADDLDDLPPAVRKAKEARSAHHKRLEAWMRWRTRSTATWPASPMPTRCWAACSMRSSPDRMRTIRSWCCGATTATTTARSSTGASTRSGSAPRMCRSCGRGRASRRGRTIDATVSLIDMFPTLTELCGVAEGSRTGRRFAGAGVEGSCPAKDRDVLLPGMKPGEYAIINQDWRYIRYADGTEELYNVRQDPNEWDNLAGNPDYIGIKDRMIEAAPKSFAEPGLERNQLKLVIDGEQYHWEEK